MKFFKQTVLALLFFTLALSPIDVSARELPARGLFVSVIQEPSVLSSRARIEELIEFAKKAQIDTLYIQVYRANKSWFDSKLADASPYRECVRQVGRDPLALLIEKGHASGIKVHAWMNLLSLSANTEALILKKYGAGILTRNRQEKKTLEDYKIDNQYFLEPGDLRVRQELSVITGELLRAYPRLDGLQLDYIRYPDVNPAYGHTTMNLNRFRSKTGIRDFSEDSPAWKKWKYDQVTALVRELAKRARIMRPGIQVSTTGLVPYSRASFESFQDWRQWVRTGLVDFVTLMCYPPDLATFEYQLRDARKQAGTLENVNIAVGAYKLRQQPDEFSRQWRACEESDSRSCVVLHYGSLIENSALVHPLVESAPARNIVLAQSVADKVK